MVDVPRWSQCTVQRPRVPDGWESVQRACRGRGLWEALEPQYDTAGFTDVTVWAVQRVLCKYSLSHRKCTLSQPSHAHNLRRCWCELAPSWRQRERNVFAPNVRGDQLHSGGRAGLLPNTHKQKEQIKRREKTQRRDPVETQNGTNGKKQKARPKGMKLTVR